MNSQELLHAIDSKTARVGVVGLGYVGLPLIRAFVEAGYKTLGFDVDSAKINQLQSGRSYIKHIASEWIQQQMDAGTLEVTDQMTRLSEADVVLICVPTPLNTERDPDLSYVEQTVEQIAAVLRVGQLVVLESTTYPGTTRDVVLPLLEKSGLQVGKDFYLAYSPEREDPGNDKFSAQQIPKVIGGIDAASLELADALYGRAVVGTVPVSNCEIAEACKILENTYRSVNIAMVNELKVLFDKLEIDIWEVIAAAKTKPFGFQAFYPGPGLGGHCIPIDPFYLSWIARRHGMTTRFIELAGEVNASMPDYVVSRIKQQFSAQGTSLQASRIGLLGVAYKKDVDDPRESPAFRLLELLAEAGAELSYSDPWIPELPKMRSFDVPDLSSSDLTPDYLANLDCVVVCTDHSVFDYQLIADHASFVVDTRNAMAHVNAPAGIIIKA
ncbi:MAG: nucleotide sugar dehydrogenase [Planctomycetota bacterium]|nr:nucleotide sugar dehydrogenase [Planctomycetota bacterium]